MAIGDGTWRMEQPLKLVENRTERMAWKRAPFLNEHVTENETLLEIALQIRFLQKEKLLSERFALAAARGASRFKSFPFPRREKGNQTRRRRREEGGAGAALIDSGGGVEDVERKLFVPVDDSGGHRGGAAQLRHRAQRQPPLRGHRQARARPPPQRPLPLPRQHCRVRLEHAQPHPFPLARHCGCDLNLILGADFAATTSTSS
jgi:hypothetical protein